MKRRIEFLLLAISIFILSADILAAIKVSNEGIWKEIADDGLKRRSNERLIVPNAYKTFRADTDELRKVLADAPKESFGMAQPKEVSRFRILQSWSRNWLQSILKSQAISVKELTILPRLLVSIFRRLVFGQ
jgi:hypothetical protein